MEKKLHEAVCCYCGRRFTPFVKKEEHDTQEFFEKVCQTMNDLIDDGMALECGECRGTEFSAYPERNGEA